MLRFLKAFLSRAVYAMFYQPKESLSPMTLLLTMDSVNHQLFILGMVSDRKIEASTLKGVFLWGDPDLD